jgi:hypothetical protein
MGGRRVFTKEFKERTAEPPGRIGKNPGKPRSDDNRGDSYGPRTLRLCIVAIHVIFPWKNRTVWLYTGNYLRIIPAVIILPATKLRTLSRYGT